MVSLSYDPVVSLAQAAKAMGLITFTGFYGFISYYFFRGRTPVMNL
jgi:hypothetical protein